MSRVAFRSLPVKKIALPFSPVHQQNVNARSNEIYCTLLLRIRSNDFQVVKIRPIGALRLRSEFELSGWNPISSLLNRPPNSIKNLLKRRLEAHFNPR